MRLHRLQIPLRSPFRTAAGSVDHRDILLIEVTGPGSGDEEGGEVSGWGEAAPFPGQDEPMDALLAEAASGRLTTTLRAGIDQAESDLRARQTGSPILPEAGESVRISRAIGLTDPVGAVDAAVELGIDRFKLKIAPGLVGHVATIRADHPEIAIGLDANRSFPDSEIGQLYGLVKHDLAYIEEPFVNWDERGAGRLQKAGVPLFADESISRLEDVSRLLLSGATDGVTIKPGRLGWSGALQAIETTEKLGGRWRASGLLETSIGRAFTNRLASLPAAFISDVAPADLFLEADVARSSHSNGQVLIPQGPGIGIDPDPSVIDRYRIAVYELGV